MEQAKPWPCAKSAAATISCRLMKEEPLSSLFTRFPPCVGILCCSQPYLCTQSSLVLLYHHKAIDLWCVSRSWYVEESSQRMKLTLKVTITFIAVVFTSRGLFSFLFHFTLPQSAPCCSETVGGHSCWEVGQTCSRTERLWGGRSGGASTVHEY